VKDIFYFIGGRAPGQRPVSSCDRTTLRGSPGVRRKPVVDVGFRTTVFHRRTAAREVFLICRVDGLLISKARRLTVLYFRRDRSRRLSSSCGDDSILLAATVLFLEPSAVFASVGKWLPSTNQRRRWRRFTIWLDDGVYFPSTNQRRGRRRLTIWAVDGVCFRRPSTISSLALRRSFIYLNVCSVRA
jgi:hypothetical protein